MFDQEDRQKTRGAEELWIVVKVDNYSFAVNALDVEDMVAMPRLTRLPEAEDYLPGTIGHRGRQVPLVDLRVLLGKESIQKEAENLCSIMTAREEDHRNWLNHLEKSVRDHTEFALTTDPHACAFGQWYDTFETRDLVLRGLLRKFDAPHRQIHAIADQVREKQENDDFDGAHSLIERTRNVQLAKMVELFENVRQALRESARREVAIVLAGEHGRVAFSSDLVESVEELAPESISDSEMIFPPAWTNWVRSVGRREKQEKDLVLILRDQFFFDLSLGSASVAAAGTASS